MRLSCAFLFLLLAASAALAQNPAPRLKAQADTIDIRDGDQVRAAAWRLSAAANPDIYTVQLDQGERRRICFVSGPESLCREVGVGEGFDFIVEHQGVDYPTRIEGAFVRPMAVFDAAYQSANRGRIRISVPEIYELVNVAIALTETARADRWLVVRDTPYYQALEAYFAPVRDHPFVRALDAELRRDPAYYFHLKMNGYAFDYDAGGRIVRNGVYDRTGFAGDPVNHLLPHLEQMRDFSAASRFRAFYAAHRPFYEGQIAYYRDEIDIADMLAWLGAQFPAIRLYDTTNIVFSPLVGGNQSVTSFESNGFRELQPHINFPYPLARDAGLSPRAVALRRGAIVFTELNHGFINPAAESHAERIAVAMSDRALWATPGRPSDGYGNAFSLFTEMMNWGLVSLYLNDRAPEADRDRMIANLDPYMEGRGFPQFPAFNAFLVDLYRRRPPGTTIADLYPTIVDWFAAHQAARIVAPSPS
jgi:hypothetical protein